MQIYSRAPYIRELLIPRRDEMATGDWYNSHIKKTSANTSYLNNSTITNGKDTIRISDSFNIWGGNNSCGSSTGGLIAGGLVNMGLSVFSMWAESKMMQNSVNSAQFNEQTAIAGQNTSKVISDYVNADSVLDAAKQNMQDALDNLSALEAKLTSAQNAGKDENVAGSKKNIQAKQAELNKKAGIAEGDANQTKNKEAIQRYRDAKTKYDTAVSCEKDYTKLKQENTQLDGKIKGLESSGKIDGSGQAVVPDGSVSNTDGNQIQLKGGSAVDTLNSHRNEAEFYVKDKDGNKTFDPSSFNSALSTAQGLDAEYKTNEQAAKDYSDAKTKFADNENRLNDLKAQCDGKEPNATYVQSCKEEMDDAGKVVCGNDNMNVSTYVRQYDNYESQINDLDSISTEASIKEIQAQITKTKSEISGTLKKALNNAQAKFNTAEAAFNKVQQDASQMEQSTNSLQEYKNAADASKSGKKKKGGGLNPANWFGKKTAQQKAYKEQRTAYQQESASYLAAYGGSYQDVQALTQQANTETQRVDIKLDDKWKNIH